MSKILLIDGETIKTLDEVKFAQEGKLQDYLEKYPSLIPLENITDESSELICIGKEIGVPSGSMDLLFIDKNGLLTIVETKLVKNPEIRREVIGQIIEYASYVTQWNADKVIELANNYVNSDFIEVMQNRYQDDFSAEDFEASIEQNLRIGKLNLIIAVDELIEPLRAMATFINSHSTFKILLLEVSAFEEGVARKVLIPSLFGYVKNSRGSETNGTTSRWTSDRFFTEIQKLGKPEIVKQINNLYEFSRKYSDDLSWGKGTQTGSFTFRKKVSGIMISIFSVETNGHIYIRLDYIKQKVKSEVFKTLITQINSIPEIKISDIDQYPYINPVLTKEENSAKFEEIILWLLEQAKQEQNIL